MNGIQFYSSIFTFQIITRERSIGLYKKLQANYYILKVLRHVKKTSVKVSFKKQTMNSYELYLGKQHHALSSARQGYNGKH